MRRCFPKKSYLFPSFNPRTHTGCDIMSVFLCLPHPMFQSTHPHGVRQHGSHKAQRWQSFNPRTHTGCDGHHNKPVYRLLRFNPRTHTGCDLRNGSIPINRPVSIHAPTRGATDCGGASSFAKWFQSTHPHGVRLPWHPPELTPHAFQSTHPHGVRRGIRLLMYALK